MYKILTPYEIPVVYVELHSDEKNRDYQIEIELIGRRTTHHNPDRVTFDPEYFIEIRELYRVMVNNTFYCDVRTSSYIIKDAYRTDTTRKILKKLLANYMYLTYSKCRIRTHKLVDRAYVQDLLTKLEIYGSIYRS